MAFSTAPPAPLPPSKVDFDVAVEEGCTCVPQLKAGVVVSISYEQKSPDEGPASLICGLPGTAGAAPQKIGAIPLANVRQCASQPLPLKATIRSIKRDLETGHANSVSVRVVLGQAPAPPPGVLLC